MEELQGGGGGGGRDGRGEGGVGEEREGWQSDT